METTPLPRPSDRRLREMHLTPRWMDRHATYEQMAEHYSSKYWSEIVKTPQRAYNAPGPQLGHLDELYGPGSSEKWTTTQIIELLVTSTLKPNDQTWEAIRTFTPSFAVSVRAFLLTELMLFFARYKSGIYDSSFVSFDVRRIGSSFFHEYLPHRRIELGEIEDQRLAEKARRERELRRSHAVSYNRFFSAPPTTLYGIRLHFLLSLTSTAVQDLCELCHLDFPPSSPIVEGVVTKAEMEQLPSHVSNHELTVEDSWEMPADLQPPEVASAAPKEEPADSPAADESTDPISNLCEEIRKRLKP